MRTQVAIIGGGPAGLLLSQILHHQGIDTVVLERRSRAYVLSRIRAGVLEASFADLMRAAGASERMDGKGIVHEGANIAHPDGMFRIDFRALTGGNVVIYGQTELTLDLYDARDATGGTTFDNCSGVELHDIDSTAPYVTFCHGGQDHRLDCDFIAGCDGFHGPSRQAIPEDRRTEFEKTYPFGWLGLLSETPPVADELIYASSARGFALCSMRGPNLSRYYIQCPLSDDPEDWPDDKFWRELRRRLPDTVAEQLISGVSVEKSIAPLRSFVCEPMQWGRLYLCGDAAHIVPPTGAKGLNAAASDVRDLSQAFLSHYRDGDGHALEHYSSTALARIWKTQRFSWWMTNLLHRFPEQSGFDQKMQQAQLNQLAVNSSAQRVFAENYVGLAL